VKPFRAIGNNVLRALQLLTRLPDFLNWTLAVLEPLVVIALIGATGYVSYLLVWSPDQEPRRIHALAAIGQIHQNWRPALILLIVLFYRTVRTFLEQAEEALGVKKKKSLPGQELNPGSLEPER
jgi:hypothetical protein